MDPAELLPTLEEAWNLTTDGRPGPVLVNVPKDILAAQIQENPSSTVSVMRHRPPRKKIETQVVSVFEALKRARRPLLLLGGGVIISDGASALMQKFVEATGIPVATSMMAKGVIAENHPQYLGMVGMHGTPQANSAIGNCDLLIAVGCRFSDRIIGDPDKYNQNKTREIIHVDIDPAEIGKNIRPTVEIEDDAANFFAHVLRHMPDYDFMAAWSEWISKMQAKAERFHELTSELVMLNDKLLPEAVVHEISEAYKGKNPILVTDVGQHQMFASQYFSIESPRSFLTSGGLGTMGFGLPAAIGAAIAAPDLPVVLFVGDGGIQMTIQEFGTLQNLGLNVKVIIMDNQQLGMVRQWQQLFFGKRYSHSILDNNPNFIQIADAYGIKGGRATNALEFRDNLAKMLSTEEPYVFHVILDAEELVYPMIPQGKNQEDIIMPGM